jgi:hypothetical protein
MQHGATAGWTGARGARAMSGSCVTGESAPADESAAETAAAHWHGRVLGVRVPAAWPLLAVLAVQLLLSVRPVRADTASREEATL